MGRLVVTEWVSLDGYTSGPNDDMSYVGQFFNEEMQAYESAIVKDAAALLLGRITYDSFAGSWPNVPDKPDVSEGEKDYARTLNAMPKITVSGSLTQAEWENTSVISDLSKATIEQLKAQYDGDILIYGSASVIQQLTKQSLIDEYQLLVHPILLGGGKKLFDNLGSPVKLSLKETNQFQSGVIFARYALA